MVAKKHRVRITGVRKEVTRRRSVYWGKQYICGKEGKKELVEVEHIHHMRPTEEKV